MSKKKNKPSKWQNRRFGAKRKKAQLGDVLDVGINRLVMCTYLSGEVSALLRNVIITLSSDDPVTVKDTELDFQVRRLARLPIESWDGDDDEAEVRVVTSAYPEWQVTLEDGYEFILSLQSEEDRAALLGGVGEKVPLRVEIYNTTRRFETIHGLKLVFDPFLPGYDPAQFEIRNVTFYFDMVTPKVPGAPQHTFIRDNGEDEVFDQVPLSLPPNVDPDALLKKRLRQFFRGVTPKGPE